MQTVGYGAALTNADVLRMLSQQQKLNFIPNTEFNYNNSGYTLLAVIVERVSGLDFNEYMAVNFFRPLNMKTAIFRQEIDTIIPNRALSYRFPKNGVQPVSVTDELAITGSSGLYASLSDMTKWAGYVANLSITNPGLFEVITREGRLANSHIVPYGFGFWRDNFYGTPRIDHTGSWAGYRAYTVYLPEKRFAVIGVRNFDESIWKIQRPIIRDVLSMKFDMKLETGANPTPKKEYFYPDVSEYKNLPGTYRLSGSSYLNVKQAESSLLISIFPKYWGASEPSQKVELKLNTNREFEAPELTLTFAVDEKNDKQLLVYDSNSGSLRYTRLEESEINLHELTGTYYSEELNTTFKIELTDGQFYISNLRSEKIILQHIAGLDFDGNNKRADFVSFLRDSHNRISALEVSTERSRNQRFERLIPESDVK